MSAYRGPREGHDAWQGDAYHQHMMERTAEHIGHPKDKAHELHMMDKEELAAKLKAAGPLPKETVTDAMMHQAHANRQHPHYQRVAARRKRLVEHPEAQGHFGRITELLNEHHAHGTSEARQLEIHDELRDLQAKIAHVEKKLDVNG